MKKLLLPLALLIVTPAFACSEDEISNQRLAAVADNICDFTQAGAIKKNIGKELFNGMLETIRKDYGTERLIDVIVLMKNKVCEL